MQVSFEMDQIEVASNAPVGSTQPPETCTVIRSAALSHPEPVLSQVSILRSACTGRVFQALPVQYLQTGTNENRLWAHYSIETRVHLDSLPAQTLKESPYGFHQCQSKLPTSKGVLIHQINQTKNRKATVNAYGNPLCPKIRRVLDTKTSLPWAVALISTPHFQVPGTGTGSFRRTNLSRAMPTPQVVMKASTCIAPVSHPPSFTIRVYPMRLLARRKYL